MVEFAAARAVLPYYPAALTGAAVVHSNAGRWHDALAAAESAMALGDTTTGLPEVYGGALGRTGRCREALSVLESFVRTHPEWRAARVEMARCLVLVGRSVEAVGALREGIRLEPGVVNLRRWLLDALMRAGQPDSAFVEAGRVTEQWPDDAIGWMSFGRLAAVMNQPVTAHAAYERAFALRPGLADSLSPMDRDTWARLQASVRAPPRSARPPSERR